MDTGGFSHERKVKNPRSTPGYLPQSSVGHFFSSKDFWSKAITSPTHITSLHLLMTVLSLLSSFFFSLLLSKTTAGEQEAWFARGKINAI